MSFHLSGSDLEVNFALIPQCTLSRSDSSSDGACVAGVNTWWQAWLLCCTLVQWLVAVVAFFLLGVKIVTSQVREMMWRFDVAAESAVRCVRGADSADWLHVIDSVAGVMGTMVLLSFLVEEISVHRGVLCDGFIVAMGLAVVCQSGGGAGQQLEMEAVRVTVATEYVSDVETAALGAVENAALNAVESTAVNAVETVSMDVVEPVALRVVETTTLNDVAIAALSAVEPACSCVSCETRYERILWSEYGL